VSGFHAQLVEKIAYALYDRSDLIEMWQDAAEDIRDAYRGDAGAALVIVLRELADEIMGG
jgi:hypothetical protein